MYGDTTVIRAHARRMRERGDDIREQAEALLGNAESVPWMGAAADAMRELARQHAAGLRACAGLHEDAATALERHAREVDRVKDLIASIEHRVLGIVESATSRVVSLVDHLVPDAFDDWVKDFKPPAHGSLAWLEVSVPRSA